MGSKLKMGEDFRILGQEMKSENCPVETRLGRSRYAMPSYSIWVISLNPPNFHVE